VSVRQPARMTEITRAQFTNNKVVRSQGVAGAKQKLVQVTLWVDPAVKEHIQRKAAQEGQETAEYLERCLGRTSEYAAKA
jgi:hypothetical protein